jgi:hypothetical protein
MNWKILHSLGHITFSSIVSKSETAKPARHLAATTRQADLNKHGSVMFNPYTYQVLEHPNNQCCKEVYVFTT